MRRAALLALVTACGGGSGMPDGGVARCDGPLVTWATREGDSLVARCGAIEVRARPLANGVVQLRYAATGAPVEASWAIVGAVATDPAAAIGGDGLCTAAMTVRIDDHCRVKAQLADGTVIAEDAEPFAVDASATLARAAHGEHVYGLGERTGGLDKRGRVWTFWNTDAYDAAYGGWKPGQDPMYQSIAFELRLANGVAFGVFTDEPRRMTIDLGSADPARDAIAAVGARSLTQYLIAGPRPAEVVDRYTALTGRPALPPRWALGFHQSRWGYTNRDELLAIAARFRSEGIPADALWLDIQHLRGFRTFTFDDQAFPGDTIPRLQALGFHVLAIEDPGIKIDPGWDVYDSGVAGGHFVRDASGGVYAGTAWAGASAFPDMTRAETRAWWGEQITRVADRGVAGIWLDVNEPTTFPEGGGGTTLPDELAVAGGQTMASVHNVYGLLEANATYDALAARGAPFVLSRAGYAGIQRYAAVWTGDTPSTWDGLRQTLPMLLGLGMSGVPIVGSDIGGYSGHATPELYARWLALGSISPFARAHVTQGVPGQEPWMFGDEVRDLARDRLVDRYHLLPYLYSLADEAQHTGAPILRPLVFEFPDDPAVADLADEAMLGPGILAAPVLEEGAASRVVYLPAGRWYELASGAIYDGPTTIDASITLAALPLYARAGAILPTSDGIDVYPIAWPAATATRFTLVEDSGRTTIEVAGLADGARVAITHDGPAPARSLAIRIHRVDAAGTVDGAQTTYDADARVLTATVADAASLELRAHYDPAIADPLPPVAVTFEVHVPSDTPQDPAIHVATSATGWTHTPLAWVGPGVARGSVVVPRGAWLDYKFTRGGWETVEKRADCSEARNRYRIGASGTRVDTVATWRDRCGN